MMATMVEPTDVEMAVMFCLRMSVDAMSAPKQPWSTEGRWIIASGDRPVAEVVNRPDGQLIAGMMTGATHINQTFHRLARLLVEAGKEGWDSNAGKRLKMIIQRLMMMEADGRLPNTEPKPEPKL